MRRALLVVLVALTAASAARLAIGATAPDFSLKDLSGTTRRLASHQGKAKAIALIWFSSECPVCRKYEARVQALYEEFKGRGVVLYTINSNQGETVESIRAHHRAAKLTFPVLKDPRNKVADAYGAVATPEVFLLDGQRKLRYRGAIDNSEDPKRVDPEQRYARKAILALLAGRKPDPAEARGLGCAIDRE